MMIPGTRSARRFIDRSSEVPLYQGGVVSLDGLPVAIKTLDAEYPGRIQVAELRREYHIALRLQPVECVIRVHALEAYGNGNLALVLEPFGRSLAEQITTAAPRPKFSLAHFRWPANATSSRLASPGMADALGRVHEARSSCTKTSSRAIS